MPSFNGSFTATPDISQIQDKLELDTIIDHIIDGSKTSLETYKKKVKDCDAALEKRVRVDDLPEDVKIQLKDILYDHEVFCYGDAGSRLQVRLCEAQLTDSLRRADQLAEVHRTSHQLASITKELEDMNKILLRKLEISKNHAKNIDRKTNEIGVKMLGFKANLARAEELKNLEELSKRKEKPKYTHQDIRNMQNELKCLEEEIAVTKAKKNKYHNLPLYEAYAAKELDKVFDEIKKVDIELGKAGKDCL